MNSRRQFLLLGAALTLLAACKGDDDLPAPPIIRPFEVQKTGTIIEADFYVEDQRKYNFELRFRFNDQVDRKRVAKIVGHPKNEGVGVPIPLHIRVERITTSEEVVILNKEISELTLTGFSADQFFKVIVSFDMPPGHYRVRVDSLKNIPELQGTQIEFAIVQAYVGK